LLIDNTHFRNQIGVSVATAYSTNGTGVSTKSAVVRNSMFEPLDFKGAGTGPSESISMNYETTPRDPQPRDPLFVYDYNQQRGHDFKVYYSYQAPEGAAPCHNTLQGIGGWVCK
jgi:hypothetical protein